jgi:hypothetical protein
MFHPFPRCKTTISGGFPQFPALVADWISMDKQFIGLYNWMTASANAIAAAAVANIRA